MRPRGLERHLVARTTEAFSILELLIALVIIGIMVMTVAPSLQQVLGDSRQVTAAGDLVRIGRRARGAAIESGVAHMLHFREAEPAGSNLGLIQLYAGMNSKCLQTNWAQARLVTAFDTTEYNPSTGSTQPTASDGGRQVITLRAQTLDDSDNPTPRAVLRLCFQPNGDVYTTASDGTDGQLVMQRHRVQFRIARSISGVPYGVERRILFPPAGSMRFE